MTNDRRDDMSLNDSNVRCPSCAAKGRVVRPVMVRSLVNTDVLDRLGAPDGFRFCGSPSCKVACCNNCTPHPHYVLPYADQHEVGRCFEVVWSAIEVTVH